MSVRPASPIPWFDRKPVNPFAPIGISAAVARSVGQEPAPDLIRGRPQAGARALPLTEASTVARSRSVGGGARVRGLIITAIVLAMTGGSISAVSAASAKTQSAPTAATNPVNPYAGYIAEASRRFGIPENWIRAVMRVEKSRPGESRVAKRRDRADADHAGYLGRIAPALPARPQSP
jgi:hypothetical protein